MLISIPLDELLQGGVIKADENVLSECFMRGCNITKWTMLKTVGELT